MDHELWNVQLEVKEDTSGKAVISLRDSCGTFVEACSSPSESGGVAVEPPEVEDQNDDYDGTEFDQAEVSAPLEEVHARNQELEDLNDELSTQVSTLKGEVSTLTDKLKREIERVNRVLHMSCEQVSDFDEAVTA